MDRISSSTQSPTPFCYESLPNEVHQLILSQIPGANSPAGRPTLRSVSCVNQRLHGMAMPFLMECYVSMMEIAFPAISSEQKVTDLTQLKNWLAVHANQMPLNAFLAAMNRTQKLIDGLNLPELESFTSGVEHSFPTISSAPTSVEDMIAMQMSLASYQGGTDKLAAKYHNFSFQIEKLYKTS